MRGGAPGGTFWLCRVTGRDIYGIRQMRDCGQSICRRLEFFNTPGEEICHKLASS